MFEKKRECPPYLNDLEAVAKAVIPGVDLARRNNPASGLYGSWE